ncbi:MAG: hypothetical protein NC097_06445 [Clostridium sp.]|nr:hypothetical protein [Prevotella sp.]MCM1429419.1 hypothetical protein [Clostridium sp.]
MKKLLLIPAIALLLFASCDDDSVDERTVSYYTSNLVIPDDASEPVSVSKATYVVNAQVSEGRLAVSSSSVKIGSQDASLSTDFVSYKSWATNVGSLNVFSGATGRLGGMPVTSFDGAISAIFYYPNPVVNLPGIDFIPAAQFGPMAIFQYRVADKYSVKTFSRDAVYGGKTITHFSYQGQAQTPFESESIMYRLVMSQDYRTADLIIYKAKFAQQQPFEINAMVLKGLSLDFSVSGISATGKNLVPQVPEQDGTQIGYTPYENYTFKSVIFRTTSSDLTCASINFTVANPNGGPSYQGQFSGKYVITSLEEK